VIILVLGAYGLLGTTLCSFLHERKYKILRQGRSKFAHCTLNPIDKNQILNFIKTHRPNTVINLIANTNVDECEQYPDLAFEANVKVVENLVESYREFPFHLIHISTDQLYDSKGPSIESKIKPINTYAITKYCSEILCKQIHSTIIRTNFVGKSKVNNKASFSDWIYSQIIGNKKINLFHDVIFSPIDMNSLCLVIEEIINKRPVGLFNVGAENSITKKDFGLRMAYKLNIDIENRVNSINSKELNLIAKRPKDMSMDINLWNKASEVKLPTIDKVLEDIILEYKQF